MGSLKPGISIRLIEERREKHFLADRVVLMSLTLEKFTKKRERVQKGLNMSNKV
jgi:hypothetical protein